MKTSGSRVGFLITGRTSRQSFSMHVGSGSSVQDFVDEFMMISLVSGLIVQKFVNMLEHNCVGMSTDSCEGKASSRETCRSSMLGLNNRKKASDKALSSMNVELRTGFFPGEKYPVKSNPETSDLQHFSEDICRSQGCRLFYRSCSVLSS